MKQTSTIMGMPATVLIVDTGASKKDAQEIFDYLREIDKIFSTYKPTSEISRINNGSLLIKNADKEVQHVLALCEKTKKETNGYFNIVRDSKIDPSGIVKGYAIHQAATILRKKGYKNFFIEIAGDIEVAGLAKVGITNPFNTKEIIKIVALSDKGIATSGNYRQGEHIYNPIAKIPAHDIASITVIGPNVYEADRFATPAFAMGEKGIEFIEDLEGFEGYMITLDKKGIYTSGFEKYVATD